MENFFKRCCICTFDDLYSYFYYHYLCITYILCYNTVFKYNSDIIIKSKIYGLQHRDGSGIFLLFDDNTI